MAKGILKRFTATFLTLILGLTIIGCIDNNGFDLNIDDEDYYVEMEEDDGIVEEDSVVEDEECVLEFQHIETKNIELSPFRWGQEADEEFYLDILTIVSEDVEFVNEGELIVNKDGVIIQYELSGRYAEVRSPGFGSFFVPRAGIRNRLDFDRMEYSMYFIPLTLRENDAIQVTYFVNEEEETVGIIIVRVELHQGYPLRLEIRADLKYSGNTPMILEEVLRLHHLQEIGIEASNAYCKEEMVRRNVRFPARYRIHPGTNWEADWHLQVTEGKESFVVGETEFYMFTLCNTFAEVEVPLFATEPISFCGQIGMILSEEYIFVSFHLHTVPTNWLPEIEEYFMYLSTTVTANIQEREDYTDVVIGDIISGNTWFMQTFDYNVIDDTRDGLRRTRNVLVVKDFGGFSVMFLFQCHDLDATELTEQSLDDALQAIIGGDVQ